VEDNMRKVAFALAALYFSSLPIFLQAQTPSTGAPVQVQMPSPPSMRYAPGMEEPLVATGPVTDQENKDLDLALATFHDAPAKAGRRGDYDDYAQPLLAFIAAHPDSNWNAALNLNLGLGYYHSAYYSLTFDYFEKAWQLGRNATTPQARSMVDRAVAELAEMHARLGHAKELESLFADIGDRPIGGSAVQMIEGAREGLGAFHSHPEFSYLCGPASLKNILALLKASPAQIKIADDARSGPHGFSLQQLAELADQTGLKVRLVYRHPGQPIPVPSIINWKVHHYAAIVDRVDGVYHIQDPTFGKYGGFATAQAIDVEGSGYFLVPVTTEIAEAESGLRTIEENSAEAKAVYGMGDVYNVPPGMCTKCDLGITPQTGSPMTVASARLMTTSLTLTDTPVGYKAQKGPSVYETLTYNGRDGDQPANFSFSNVSPLWTHTWQAYIQDDPNNPGVSVTRIVSGGGGYDYSVVQNGTIYTASTGAFVPETYDNSQLYRYPAEGPATSYIRYLPDGSQEVYAQFNSATTYPRYVFLTQFIDPTGNALTFAYETEQNSVRLTSATDAMGRSTTFQYGLTGFPLLITKIIDPFGRFSKLTYDTSGRLSSITDPIGITSMFTYGSATETNFITQLTTPYGTSKFSDTLNPNDPVTTGLVERSLALTDPLGYVDFLYVYLNPSVTGTPYSEGVAPTGMNLFNQYLYFRNTYYWDRHESANGGVTTDANGNPIAEKWTVSPNVNYPVVYHWFHFCCSINYLSNQLESLKKPLEQYSQWFNYPGQPGGEPYYSGTLIEPIAIGRVLDDGSTQLTQATYNSLGLPLTNIDPDKRSTQFTYATNNIDLLTVSQLTASPSTYTTIATFGNYNTQHEPQTYTGADGQAWNYTYNSAGQLAIVTDPKTERTRYNYDTLGRLSTIVDADKVTVLTLTYDGADRVLTRTDSEGYTLTYGYDNLDRVTTITYPDGTTDLYNYDFQSGPNKGHPSLDLRGHTDRLGRVTIYNYDADRRLISVTEPLSAGKTRTTSYDYYENGTLKDITDADGNVTHWEIDLQSRPTSKTYAYGTSQAQTETYTYETNTSRLLSVTDALSQVKTYSYAEDDRISGITYTGAVNSTPNVTFAWDPYFPRLSSMIDGLGTTNYSYTAIGTDGALKLSSIDGPYNNDVIGLTYDTLGRLSGRNIPGGNESFRYDAIGRLIGHNTPLGPFTYGYLGETDQTTSRSVTNGTVTVSTGWGYDTNTNDRRLIAINNSGVTRSYALGYTSGGVTNPYDILSISDNAALGHPFASQSHSYGYDNVDRLLSATATTPGNDSYVYNKLDDATTVTTPVGTANPTYNKLNQIDTWGSLHYDYDADGNLLSGDGVKTYKWDAENRLVEIDYVGSSAKSQFSYDGMGHRTVDVETSTTGAITTSRYLWCGSSICQTRNGSDIVLRRDLDEGEVSLSTGQKLVYMPDQLSSVRDLLASTAGSLVDAYDYTPYGSIAQSYGNTPVDYEYAGLLRHPASGLNLSATRAMDGVTGRWLVRDPIGKAGGINLYGYVGADPTSNQDTEGLRYWSRSLQTFFKRVAGRKLLNEIEGEPKRTLEDELEGDYFDSLGDLLGCEGHPLVGSLLKIGTRGLDVIQSGASGVAAAGLFAEALATGPIGWVIGGGYLAYQLYEFYDSSKELGGALEQSIRGEPPTCGCERR
jgi:RHS repeat-associated protein